MPRRFTPGQPAQPVTPTQTARQRSRLCFETWDAGCNDHGGQAHRCTRTWRHGGPCECECSSEK